MSNEARSKTQHNDSAAAGFDTSAGGAASKAKAKADATAKADAKADAKARQKSSGKQTKELIKNLSPEQRLVLLKRLAEVNEEALQDAAGEQLKPRKPQTEAPLSFAQERAWFLDRMVPENYAHNITGALRLKGDLSREALCATFDGILRRHETLRSNIHAPNGNPVLRINSAIELPLKFIDISEVPTDKREDECLRQYTEETRLGFDLARDIPIRITLIRVGPESHLLVIAVNHIAADGWSIGVLMREISEFYTAFVESRDPNLPVLPIQYGDFAVWERDRERGGALERDLSFWREQLTDLPPVLELSPDHGGLSSTTGNRLEGGTEFMCFERSIKQSLDELSRQEETTLFVTLLTGFMSLLMRCTGQQDIVVGSPLGGRRRVETENLVGPFLNTLALRAALTPDLTFREALSKVRSSFLGALDHAETPFEKIVQDLVPDRAASTHPLFETVFNFAPTAPRTLKLSEVRADVEEPPEMGAKFSMELFVMEREGTLEFKALYPRERYSGSHISNFLSQYQHLLEQAVRDPDERLGSFDLTTPDSRRLLPDPVAPLDCPAQASVPHDITRWVSETPDALALFQEDSVITYSEMGIAMTLLAERLIEEGLERGQTVAILGPRCPGVVVAMSAALLAGGILQTLSQDLPEARHQVMLKVAEAKILLHVGDWRTEDEWVRSTSGIRIIEVSEAGDLADQVGDKAKLLSHDQCLSRLSELTRTHADIAEAAYIFFTSGSAGEPKGVLGSHAGLAHWLAWQRSEFDVGPGDRCGQLTGLSFDVVLRDVFLPLISGATLVIPGAGDLASADRTLRWLERESISLLHTVPGVAAVWLSGKPDEVSLSRLKRIFFAGESLPGELVDRWREAFPMSGECVNLYGPTETTLAKCFYRIPGDPDYGIQPLGETLPQAQALVLTPERRLCGIGEPGEIAIRTPFRSLGYLNAPEESRSRFIANPFNPDPGDVVYLTGDRGVYGADGVLRFLGRLDHQVKIRGVRVEPEEVSVALQTHPEVASCAVIAREDQPSGTYLAAYLVMIDGATGNVGKLQEFLSRRLPAAMVPAAFVFLDSLPLTANQKLDRKRLPAPEGVRPILERDYREPRDATELQLVQIWENLLGVSPIGIGDNFFELGGHSLMALRLLVEIEKRLGWKITVASFFEGPTIEQIAAASRQSKNGSTRTVRLWEGKHPQKFFLVHPGGGVLWNYIPLVRHLDVKNPVYGIQASGLDGEDPPSDNITEMAADYIEEVRREQPEGPYLLAGHSSGGIIAFEMARLLEKAGQEVDLLAMFDSALPASQTTSDSIDDERLGDARGLANMIETIERFVGRELGVSYENLSVLSTDDQIEAVVEALTHSDALAFAGGAEMTRSLLKVSKAHMRASRAYRPQASHVPITLFRARQAEAMSGTSQPDAASDGESSEEIPDESLGWSAYSTTPPRVLWTPGDHVTILSEPNVKILAEKLNSCLADAIKRHPTTV